MVERLNRRREANMRGGRVFDDSTELIRRGREERSRELERAPEGRNSGVPTDRPRPWLTAAWSSPPRYWCCCWSLRAARSAPVGQAGPCAGSNLASQACASGPPHCPSRV